MDINQLLAEAAGEINRPKPKAISVSLPPTSSTDPLATQSLAVQRRAIRDERILQLVHQGIRYNRIAEQLGVSDATVSQVAMRNGVTIKHRPPTPTQRVGRPMISPTYDIIRDLICGKSVDEIAATSGVKKQAVEQIAARCLAARLIGPDAVVIGE